MWGSNFWSRQIHKPTFGPEIFANPLFVHSLASNLDQKCTFSEFESGPKPQFGRWSWILKINSLITCQSVVLIHFQIFRMCTFCPDFKLTPSNIFLDQKLDSCLEHTVWSNWQPLYFEAILRCLTSAFLITRCVLSNLQSLSRINPCNPCTISNPYRRICYHRVCTAVIY